MQLNRMAPSAMHTLATGVPISRVDPAAEESGADTSQELLSMDPQVHFWIHKISTALGNSAGWLILTGKHLIQAKQALGRGKWMAMFEAGGLKFGLRTAEILMKIAQHPGLRNSKHLTSLPPSCAALYQLAYAEPEAIDIGIAGGQINPQMTAVQAKAFVRGQQAENTGETPTEASFNFDRRLKSVNRFVLKEANSWPLEDRQHLAELLTVLAQKILSDAAPSCIEDEG